MLEGVLKEGEEECGETIIIVSILGMLEGVLKALFPPIAHCNSV
mgnify:CR=1 FL=1